MVSMRNLLSLVWCSPIGKVSFLSLWWLSNIFIPAFSFQKFENNLSWCEFPWLYLVWSLLSLLNLWDYVFFQIWEIFSHFFHPSSFFFCDCDDSYVKSFITVWVPEALFIFDFKSIFLSFVQIGSFLLFLKFTDSFFCHLVSCWAHLLSFFSF